MLGKHPKVIHYPHRRIAKAPKEERLLIGIVIGAISVIILMGLFYYSSNRYRMLSWYDGMHSGAQNKRRERFRFEFAKMLKEKGADKISDFDVIKLIDRLSNDSDNHNHNGVVENRVHFIQVGACDGEFQSTNDPIQKMIYTSNHWYGCMLEPVPFIFKKLQQSVSKHVTEYEKRILLLNAALSDNDGHQDFFIVNDDFQRDVPTETHALKFQIGSFDKNHPLKHLTKIEKKGKLPPGRTAESYIDTISVKAMTPATVTQKFADSGKAKQLFTQTTVGPYKKTAKYVPIDVLLIDVEGYDYIALKKFMQIDTMRPLLIVYESLHLSEEEKNAGIALLESLGYLTFNIQWNVMAVYLANT